MELCLSSFSTIFLAVIVGVIHYGQSTPLPTEDNTLTIVSRQEWGARASKTIEYLIEKQPLPFVYIHHASSEPCFNQFECSKKVRGFQNFHMDGRGWDDIGYSFLIGGDGSIYEGRGWDRVGAHTKGHNTDGLGFCLIGDFMSDSPTDVQIKATQTIISYGVSLKKLVPDYKVLGHRDVVATTCPGTKLYALIQSWPHYGRQSPVIG